MVGQNVLGQHAELLAEEQYNTTKKTYADIESIMKHLNDQDASILNIVQKLDARMSDDIN
jgi:pyruvoyl-dependent arginine decarboxylase (PvlArgDC)